MADTATVTGKIGPGLTLTAGVFTNLTYFNVDTVNNVLTFSCDQGQNIAVDITTNATFTVSKSGSNYTLTVS